MTSTARAALLLNALVHVVGAISFVQLDAQDDAPLRANLDSPDDDFEAAIFGQGYVQQRPETGDTDRRDFMARSSAEKDLVKQEEALIYNIIKLYTEEHDFRSYNASKGFVVGAYGCPGQFGNRMHEFLNAFAIAVITDRTLLWRYTNQAKGVHEVGTLKECSNYINRRNWIPSVDVLGKLNEEIVELNWESSVDVACGRVHLETAAAIAPGKKLEQYQACTLAQDFADISPEMGLRAKRLMARGPEFLYGMLFKSAFRFTHSEVVGPSRQVLSEAGLIDQRNRRSPADQFWVGAHIRHKRFEDTVEDRARFATKFSDAITELVQESKARNCAVFLATDDDVTEGLLTPHVAELGCKLVRSKMGKPQPDFRNEHGNNTGAGAVRDLYLLSMADVLVGTGFSSFTMTISEQLRSLRGSLAPVWRCLDSKLEMPCRQQTDSLINIASIEENTCRHHDIVAHRVLKRAKLSDAVYTPDQQIEMVISGYIESHRSRNEQLLFEHPVVVGRFSQPLQPASALREFANAFAVAVITNRALVWEYPAGANSSEELSGDRLFGVNLVDWVPTVLLAEGNRRDIATTEHLACADLDEDGDNILNISGLGGYEASVLLSRASLSAKIRQRAEILFALGPEHLYGRLIQSAISFDRKQVVEPVTTALREVGLLNASGARGLSNSTWVSVFASHKSNASEEELTKFARVLGNETDRIISSMPADDCVVLLCSDDNITEGVLTQIMMPKHCTVVKLRGTVPERREIAAPGVDSSKAKDDDAGGHRSLGLMRLIHFLSFSDAYVGTARSGISQSVVEMFKARSPDAFVTQCTPTYCTESREWLNNYRVPEDCNTSRFSSS